MPKKCEVPFCQETGAHKFPIDNAVRKLWVKAIRRRNFKPENTSRLCRKHFLESDYQKISNYTGTELQHRYLKKNAVPSIFAWTTKNLSQQAQEREDRLTARNIKKSLFEPSTSMQQYTSAIQVLNHSYQDDIISNIDISGEQCIEAEDTILLHEEAKKTISCGTQTSATLKIFSTDLMLADDNLVSFYTGLENEAKFNLVLCTLLPMANNLKYRWSQVVGVPVTEQFLILLMKLRRNKPDIEIAKLFNISKTEVSNIIVTWIHFVNDLWSFIDIWPRRELVDFYMPKAFREQSAQTRIIIDATEVPIAKPSNPTAQRATFSTYKHTNTLKFLVGATPGGLLSFCSHGYGGATSDRQIVERSTLLNICENGDSIMADRGFNVQDLFAPKNVSVNIPTFLKGKSQIPGVLLKQDRKIASQRVHIERLIGLTKTYKILQNKLNAFYVPLVSKIFFICFMLCNFREGIVNNKRNTKYACFLLYHNYNINNPLTLQP